MEKKRKFLINLILLILATTILFAQEEEKIKPIEVDSFPEFFEKVHIGMKDEEILKIFNYSFKIVLMYKNISEFPNYQIYEDNNIFDSIEYKKIKFGIGFLFYKNILFQIGMAKYHKVDKNNNIIGEKTTIEDYYNIINEFKQNKEYIIVSDEIQEYKNIGASKSIINYVTYLMKNNDDKIIMISFQEEIFIENLSKYLSIYTIQIFQIPYPLYLANKDKDQEKKYKALDQFVSSYLK